MYKGHPWEKAPFGKLAFESYAAWRIYTYQVFFDVDFRPFIAFCRNSGVRPNDLLMKIVHSLSIQFLPQYVLSYNGRPYPAKYPAGYSRKSSDGLPRSIALTEGPEAYHEIDVLEEMSPLSRFLAAHFPRFCIFMLRHFLPSLYTDSLFTVAVTRNYLKSLPIKFASLATSNDGLNITIPYGDVATCSLSIPHILGDPEFFEPFLAGLKRSFEKPETIDPALISKEYHQSGYSPQRHQGYKDE
jgi:hypothetical protein